MPRWLTNLVFRFDYIDKHGRQWWYDFEQGGPWYGPDDLRCSKRYHDGYWYAYGASGYTKPHRSARCAMNSLPKYSD